MAELFFVLVDGLKCRMKNAREAKTWAARARKWAFNPKTVKIEKEKTKCK